MRPAFRISPFVGQAFIVTEQPYGQIVYEYLSPIGATRSHEVDDLLIVRQPNGKAFQVLAVWQLIRHALSMDCRDETVNDLSGE
ncbi:MAG: hypothetical protein V3V05_08320 [Pontiella sp.]